jgi:hypothetical protein
MGALRVIRLSRRDATCTTAWSTRTKPEPNASTTAEDAPRMRHRNRRERHCVAHGTTVTVVNWNTGSQHELSDYAQQIDSFVHGEISALAFSARRARAGT